MLCLKVPKSEGEKVRHKLLERGLLEKQGKITSNNNYLYIPIKKRPKDTLGYEILERNVEYRVIRPNDYRDVIELPENIKKNLPTSFDIIGDIALIKIPEELNNYKNEIGEAILEVQPNVETVMEDQGVVGEFRVRQVKTIAGIDKRKTIHKEYGSEFEVDVVNAYFSPRLATERWRVVGETRPHEKILDMFAGVGPYSILIAKNVEVEQVYSIDINPRAISLLKKNVKRNNVEDLVKIHEGDAKKLAPRFNVDRIIMNLPHSSFEFLDSALEASEEKCIIHYYEIVEESEYEYWIKKIRDKILECGFKPEIKQARNVRSYSAYMEHKVLDIEVRSK
ncbi:MAG: class I SAM-dependent methyltransferase [Candidatus Saliniplasma sp.]